MSKTTYENFIDNYAVDMSRLIKEFESLDKKAILEDESALSHALNNIDNIYDIGVCDYFERCICGSENLTIVSMADRALNNMNRYGTEMRQIINALEDLLHNLSKFLPEDDDYDFSDEDMKDAFK